MKKIKINLSNGSSPIMTIISNSTDIDIEIEKFKNSLEAGLAVLDYFEILDLTEEELKESKSSRTAQLKQNRDDANLKPLVSVQAEEILIDDNQQETLTGNQVYFAFSTKATGQPATEPSTIVLATLLTASADPSFYTRYSCKIIEGNTSRDGYVKIDVAVAMNIQRHIQIRNLSNIHHCNVIEKSIKKASSVEESEAIGINF